MSQIVLPNYNPPLEGARSAIQYVAGAITEAGPTELKIAIGESVPLRRQTEIVNAVWFLANGIRDRNLLDDQFKGLPLATAVNINRITAADRRTAANLLAVNFAATDVAIAMGANASDNQHVVMLDTAIEMMLKVFLEQNKRQGTVAVLTEPCQNKPQAFMVTESAGSASSPANIAIHGTANPGDVYSVNVDTDASNPAVLSYTALPDDDCASVALALCAQFNANPLWNCQAENGALSLWPVAPATAVSVSGATITPA